MEYKIYNVAEITRYIKELLTKDQTLSDLWVTGEISNFHHHNSGHMYFTLKDENARLSSVMFKSDNRNLKFEPEEGLQVTAHGYVGVYVPRGDYQFYVDKMEPEGKGALYLAYQQLKEKLQEEGLFAPEKKQPIPVLPARIGIITSPTGAAIKDIISVVKRRFKNTSVLIVPSLVQGEAAADQITAGLEYLNYKQNVDLIIVSRGGGSIEDLWPFNEEKVARAIYKSKIPVISGVGHETDFTIADFTADLRAPTPSAAAERAVADKLELEKNLHNLEQRLFNGLGNIFSDYHKQIKSLAQKRVFSHPEVLFSDYLQKVDNLSQNLSWAMKNKFSEARQRWELLGSKLETLSPLKTLQRGYSICTTEEGKIITSIQDTGPGDQIKNRVVDGELTSKVQEIKKVGENDGQSG
ncbi:MAG: exodeoxyribonuclease VII large subunit [Bacillota bacterium]